MLEQINSERMAKMRRMMVITVTEGFGKEVKESEMQSLKNIFAYDIKI